MLNLFIPYKAPMVIVYETNQSESLLFDLIRHSAESLILDLETFLSTFFLSTYLLTWCRFRHLHSFDFDVLFGFWRIKWSVISLPTYSNEIITKLSSSVRYLRLILLFLFNCVILFPFSSYLLPTYLEDKSFV